MRVLVVEDDKLLAGSLHRGLTAEGYAVEVAADGVDGLHRAREFEYDAMILDVLLPGLNGVRVCAQLRADGRDLPVLMLTARDGAALDLTPREFAVLRYLLAHPEVTVTKQELLDHVWGENDAADHNVVQVYVSSLRRKIDAGGEPSLIDTIRGVGYRMREDP